MSLPTFPVRLTVVLPDGAETPPVELRLGTPVPARGDAVQLWDARGQQACAVLRVTERTLSYFPGPTGAWSCEVLLYTESV